MIALDANILVYAHRRDATLHARARDVVQSLAEGTTPWFLPWSSLHEFYGVVTHPRVYSPPSTVDEALDQLTFWLSSPSVVVGGEAAAHWATIRPLLSASRVTGPRVHDARMYAVCLAHGVSELWSADRDFSRFAGLRVRNPLV